MDSGSARSRVAAQRAAGPSAAAPGSGSSTATDAARLPARAAAASRGRAPAPASSATAVTPCAARARLLTRGASWGSAAGQRRARRRRWCRRRTPAGQSAGLLRSPAALCATRAWHTCRACYRHCRREARAPQSFQHSLPRRQLARRLWRCGSRAGRRQGFVGDSNQAGCQCGNACMLRSAHMRVGTSPPAQRYRQQAVCDAAGLLRRAAETGQDTQGSAAGGG